MDGLKVIAAMAIWILSVVQPEGFRTATLSDDDAEIVLGARQYLKQQFPVEPNDGQ